MGKYLLIFTVTYLCFNVLGKKPSTSNLVLLPGTYGEKVLFISIPNGKIHRERMLTIVESWRRVFIF